MEVNLLILSVNQLTDQPRRQPYWYHPLVLRLSVNGHPSGCRMGWECSTTTRSDRAFSFRLPPRTEDRSVPVVIP